MRRLYVLKSTQESALGSGVNQIRLTAPKLGLTVVGSAEWPEAKSYAALADRVARARPDGIYFEDLYFERPDAVLRALRDRFGDVPVITHESAGFAAPGMYVTTTGRANQSVGAEGRRFLREFTETQPEGAVPAAPLYILETAQAAETLLEAIARSDGTRTSVTRALFDLEIEDGILGSFSFDENGDMTPATISVFRITGKKRGADAPDFYGGADFDRVVRVPPALVSP